MPPTNIYQVPEEITQSERIIQYMQKTLQEADFDPVNQPGSLRLFEKVIRGSMEDIHRQWAPACSIEEGPEKTIQEMWPITDKMLRVFINFKVLQTSGIDQNEVGVDHYSLIRYYFGRITKLFITSDLWLGGLALGVTEAGNTPEVNGRADTEPGGTVYFDIHYRHEFGDMFTGAYGA
jgi:hypothetical protein